MNTNNEIWIGLVGLSPLKTNTVISQNERAFTNILLMACSPIDYENKVNDFLRINDFEILELDDVESLSERMMKFEVDSEILALAEKVKYENTPQMSTLHIFDNE